MPTIETKELPPEPVPDALNAEIPDFDPELAEALDSPPVKRGVGRPRTRFEPAELPNPRRFPLRPEEFFQFWHDCEKIDPNRLIVYVWRTFPIIDKKALHGPDAVTNIGKMEKAPEPGEWRLEMLRRWGSGNYKLMLKDEGLKKPKAICQTFVTDLNDPEYPAWIEDLDELVVEHPSNQPFINGLKQKGLWPGESDMAAGEAMGIMAGTVKDMAKQLAERPKEATKEPAPPQTPAEVAIRTIDMADKAFQQGLNLAEKVTASQVKAAEEKATAAEEKVKAAEASMNPAASLGLLQQMVEVVRTLTPAAATVAATQAAPADASATAIQKITDAFMGRITALETQIMSLQNARMEAMERMVTAAASPQAQAQSTPKDDLVTSLEKLIKLKDTLNGIGGEDDGGREEKLPAWVQLAQAGLAGLPTVATALLGMSYNMAVAKTGNGTPIAPAPPPTDPGAEPSPAHILANPSPSSPNPTPNSTGTTMNPIYLAFLKQVERPLVNHLNSPDKTGVDFALWVKDGFGDLGYQSAKRLGKDTLTALLMASPVVSEVAKAVPERLSSFIDEFLEAEEILANEDDQDDQGNEGDEPTLSGEHLEQEGDQGGLNPEVISPSSTTVPSPVVAAAVSPKPGVRRGGKK